MALTDRPRVRWLHTLGVRAGDAAFDYAQERKYEEMRRVEANAIRRGFSPHCDGRCAFEDERYAQPSAICAMLDRDPRFRVASWAFTTIWNLSVRTGLNAPLPAPVINGPHVPLVVRLVRERLRGL